MRRKLIVLLILSALTTTVCLALRVRSYTRGFWIQSSPRETFYAFKVWGETATVYRLDNRTPYPNGKAAVFEFSIDLVMRVALFVTAVLLLIVFWPGRTIAGMCPKCGYDLRASLERCPECGTPVLPGQVIRKTLPTGTAPSK